MVQQGAVEIGKDERHRFRSDHGIFCLSFAIATALRTASRILSFNELGNDMTSQLGLCAGDDAMLR